MQLRVMTQIVVSLIMLSVVFYATAFDASAFDTTDNDQHILRWSDIEAAIDKHPALHVIKDEVAAAKAEINVSRQYPNPEFGASIGQARSLDGKDSALIWGVELEIPIDAPGTYLNETKAARAGYKATKFEALAKRLEVVHQLKGLFFEIAIGQELLGVQNKNMEQVNRLVQVASLRSEHGEARPMEVTRLQIEQEKLKLKVATATSKLKVIKTNLNLWLSGTLPDNFVVEIDWQNLPNIPDLSYIIQNSSNKHPLLQAANSRIIAAEANTKTEWHRLFPEIKLGGFYDKEMDAHNYGGMLGIELPLWNWNRGGISKAQADESFARSQQKLAKLELITAIYQAHATASQAIKRARTYAKSILPKARQTGEAIEAMYRIGETDIINVLDARRSLIETETDMLAAFKDGWLAYLELITLMGDEHE